MTEVDKYQSKVEEEFYNQLKELSAEEIQELRREERKRRMTRQMRHEVLISNLKEIKQGLVRLKND